MKPPPPAAEARGVPSEAGPPLAGLAVSQLRRVRRIVDTAVQLAEEGGFEGVKLRDVAERAQVALGTLYKYFRSKEDILLYALNEDVERLEAAVAARPVEGATALDRVTEFFGRATRAFVRRPHFARAVLRSLTAGDQEIALKVAGFQLRMTRMILATIRQETLDPQQPLSVEIGTPRERSVAFVLVQVWFASLVGWAGGVNPIKDVPVRVREAGTLVLEA